MDFCKVKSSDSNWQIWDFKPEIFGDSSGISGFSSLMGRDGAGLSGARGLAGGRKSGGAAGSSTSATGGGRDAKVDANVSGNLGENAQRVL